MNGNFVRVQIEPDPGAKHSRAAGQAGICNDKLARFDASSFGPGDQGRWRALRRLPVPPVRAAPCADLSAPDHSGAGANHFVNTR